MKNFRKITILNITKRSGNHTFFYFPAKMIESVEVPTEYAQLPVENFIIFNKFELNKLLH